MLGVSLGMSGIEKKICSSCGLDKPISEFYSDRKNSDGHRGACKRCVSDYNAALRASRIVDARAYGRAYYAANRDRLLAAANDNNATPRGRINNAVSSGVWRGISSRTNGSGTTFELLGYTIDDLMNHLEALFLPGMTWENYGLYGWHIDHVRPLASFSYDSVDDPEFREAWALSNLQPLWAQDNWSKGATFISA